MSAAEAWPDDVPAPLWPPVRISPRAVAVEQDWNDPALLRSLLVETRERERDLAAVLVGVLAGVRWLLTRQTSTPRSPAAERIVIAALLSKRFGRGAFRGLDDDAFTSPERRALWLYLTARERLPIMERPSADAIACEVEWCHEAGDVTPREVASAVHEVASDARRRVAIAAARESARVASGLLELRDDDGARRELARGVGLR